MIRLDYQLQFTTPAFLGNAEQNGQWRTPPIKALLRQWWRMAVAAERGFDVAAMRRAEALLFGHAWLENDTFERHGRPATTAARKSGVRIRLSSWAVGKLTSWNGLDSARVSHPEVKNPVGSQLYLGYGPLNFANGTAMKANAAIQSGESATLSIAVPNEHAAHIEHALTLMNLYGTLGGRSRNGWGSFVLTTLEDTPALGGEIPLRSWKAALALDWPHALGQDARGAQVWQTQALPDWKAVMKRLAEIKIGLRTQFIFPHERPNDAVHDRHWLSYPITTHKVKDWDRKGLRLPNTLRFKVRPAADGQLVGVIFHVPHKPPGGFTPDAARLERVWSQVHAYLDAPAQSLERIAE